MISVIVPTFNEKGNIIPLVEAIHQELGGMEHQIVVVDDNSPDQTYQIICDQRYDYVKAILRTSVPSLAGSIRMGIEHSDGKILVVMDSDFNHQPKYIPQMVKNLEFYNVVAGSRYVYGGGMDSWWRHNLSWVFNLFVRFGTGKYMTDTLYGFFAIHRSVMEKMDYDKIFWGYGDYCIRLMYYLQQKKYTILQIPVINGRRLRGVSNSRFLKVFGQYTWETFKLVVRERLKIF